LEGGRQHRRAQKNPQKSTINSPPKKYPTKIKLSLFFSYFDNFLNEKTANKIKKNNLL
jgi:hypothetical protein